MLIYEDADQSVDVHLDTARETVWLTQRQMADVFDTSTDNIGLHLKNIFQDGELEVGATTEKSSVVHQEGQRQVRRSVQHYNLDAIISVGYRVNSKRAVQFRQWAHARFARTPAARLDAGAPALRHQRPRARSGDGPATQDGTKPGARCDQRPWSGGYPDTLRPDLPAAAALRRGSADRAPGTIRRGHLPSLDEARTALAELKAGLIERGEATDLFARERGEAFEALLAN